MRPQTQPLDPDSPAGRAAAEALTAFIAAIKPQVLRRCREQAAAETAPQKAA